MREHEMGTKGRVAAARLTLRQTVAVSRRILTEYARQRRSLIFWAVFPALMLLLFGLMYRSNPSLRAGFDTTPAGILIGAALFFSCLGGTVSLLSGFHCWFLPELSSRSTCFPNFYSGSPILIQCST
jgi:hypothetical protein